MSGLLLVAVFAQAATATGSTPAPTDSTAPKNVGAITYLDAEAGAGYSTNPFLSLGHHSGEGFGRFSLHVVHTRVSDRTTTVFSAYAQDTTYTGHYGSEQSFDVSGSHAAAISEKLHILVGADAGYDKGGQLDTRILTIPEVPLPPGTVAPPPLLNSGNDFLTVTGRTYHADGNAGAQWSLSARDFLELSSGVDYRVFKDGGLETRFTTIPFSAGYSREVSERTTLGARIAADFTHYSETLNNPATTVNVITPQLTAAVKLSPTLTFTGDIGASFSHIDNILTTRHTTGLAADAVLCSVGEEARLCARASVQDQAATSAGAARVMSAEVDYSRQVGEHDTLNFSLAADRYSNPIVVVGLPEFSRATYLRAAADYSRSLGHRWFAGVSLAARKTTRAGPDPNTDLSASVFIRYRFGDMK